MKSAVRMLVLAGMTLPLCSLVSCSTGPGGRYGIKSNADARKIESDSRTALRSLYNQNPRAAKIAEKAHGVLVFPRMTRAGFIFGGAYGDGALFERGRPTSYYRSVSASWGLQAGASQFGYALIFMDSNTLANAQKTDGWELGGAPNITVLDKGAAGSISTTSLQKGAYAVFFDQKGLMAGLGLQGTKITRLAVEQ
jgi:lipid-binding SYLF domain-containing protein